MKRIEQLAEDNVVRRHLKPALEKIGLGWINFHVLRRTYSSLMRELGVDPKVVADMMGHDIGVNLDVYTQISMERGLEDTEALARILAA